MTSAQATLALPRAALPPPPGTLPQASVGAMPDDEGEDDALCARYEAEQALREAGETAWGCDYPEGPLAAGGTPW